MADRLKRMYRVVPRSWLRTPFTRAPNGEVIARGRLRLGTTEMKGPRTSAAIAERKTVDLTEYVGMYWSDELETQYVAAVENGKLRLRHIRHGSIDLNAMTADAFTTGAWFMPLVNFTRDAQGRVAGMRVGGDRIRGIQFTRR
jgi:hypothetical protein